MTSLQNAQSWRAHSGGTTPAVRGMIALHDLRSALGRQFESRLGDPGQGELKSAASHP